MRPPTNGWVPGTRARASRQYVTMTDAELLWSPPADARERSRIGDFMRFAEARTGLEFADYDALWRWSVQDLPGFWSAVWDYFEVIAHTPPTAVLSHPQMPGA